VDNQLDTLAVEGGGDLLKPGEYLVAALTVADPAFDASDVLIRHSRVRFPVSFHRQQSPQPGAYLVPGTAAGL
jgi:hypothetical protein